MLKYKVGGFLFWGYKMPDVQMLIMTPQGPISIGFSLEDFTKFVQMLNTILESKEEIPQVFEDAFKKEEE